MKKLLTIIAIITVSIASCKKNTNTNINTPGAPTTYAGFLENTQWVGTLDRSGYQYAPPCCLRFMTNNKIVVYAPFFFIENGAFIRPDSLNGSITSIDSLGDGRTSVKANIEHLNEVTMYISNRKTLTSISTNASKPTPFQLELFTATNFSVKNTAWSGPVITTPGPTQGMLAYPDLSSIEFLPNKEVSVYYRNGKIVLAQPTPQIPTPGALEVSYRQYGAMLFMSGYDETSLKLYDYFGVLFPDATKMMVYSAATYSRLPNYTQTIAWYGPIGATPVIIKQ